MSDYSDRASDKGKVPMRNTTSSQPSNQLNDGYSQSEWDERTEVSTSMEFNDGSTRVLSDSSDDEHPSLRTFMESRRLNNHPGSRAETTVKSQLNDTDANDVGGLLRDESTPMEAKVHWVAKELRNRTNKYNEKERELLHAEAMSQELRTELDALKKNNEELFEDNNKSWGTVQQLMDALEAKKHNAAAQATAGTPYQHPSSTEIPQAQLDLLHEAQNEQRRLRSEIESRNIQISQMENTLARAQQLTTDFQAKNEHMERDSGQWSESVKNLTFNLSIENQKLRKQVNEMVHYVRAYVASDDSRWIQKLKDVKMAAARQEPATSRLTYGTLDREMGEADDPDVLMPTRPEPYVTPVVTRIQRRLANPATSIKKIGARQETAKSRKARPAEFKRPTVKSAAANSYLRIKGSKYRSGVQMLVSRKRSRVQNGKEIISRFTSIANADKLPTPPKRIGGPAPPRNPYDIRDDNALAKAMGDFSMDEMVEVVEAPKEVTPEAKIVTIKERIEHFTPRSRVFSVPRYLPMNPRSLTRDVRKGLAKVANNWSLGPEKDKSKGKKQVRFAKVVEYEPKRRATVDESEEQSQGLNHKGFGWSISWSHVIIAMLIVLLFVSNMSTPEDPKQGWRNANKSPEDATLRSSGGSGGHGSRPTMLDFEVARWSDVDPSVYG
ncbi:hypothetical protein BJX99DRAFT_220261 [Aspergillus californicus]